MYKWLSMSDIYASFLFFSSSDAVGCTSGVVNYMTNVVRRTSGVIGWIKKRILEMFFCCDLEAGFDKTAYLKLCSVSFTVLWQCVGWQV